MRRRNPIMTAQFLAFWVVLVAGVSSGQAARSGGPSDRAARRGGSLPARIAPPAGSSAKPRGCERILLEQWEHRASF